MPPNKPVVPPKKEAVTRRPDASATPSDSSDGKKKYTIPKDKIQEGEVVDSRKEPQVGSNVEEIGNARLHENSSGQGLEILGQELADFQKILCSMGAGKNAWQIVCVIYV